MKKIDKDKVLKGIDGIISDLNEILGGLFVSFLAAVLLCIPLFVVVMLLNSLLLRYGVLRVFVSLDIAVTMYVLYKGFLLVKDKFMEHYNE